jgi:hypothetical protein
LLRLGRAAEDAAELVCTLRWITAAAPNIVKAGLGVIEIRE